MLSGLPPAVQAAGLGKIVVFSALGQPLRAEIEVSATRDELSGMKPQLAPPEAFKQAGLDYATTLLSIRFSLDKRPNGQPVIKLTSDRPINDPFVDMLLELNWPAGRLVREYTFLLDPPEVAAKNVVPVAPARTSAPTATSRSSSVASRTESPIDDDVRRKALARIAGQESTAKPADRPAERRDVHEVRRGDTLHKIASETKPEGVSLEQMLVGLLRANQDAFDGGNMNRLKAGKILSIPEKSSLESMPPAEARKIVVAQSSDWNAYRSKLAGVAAQTPAKEADTSQEVAGKITAKVEDKAAPAAESKDQLKVSKTDATGSKPGVRAGVSDEDLIAKEKALKEANERLAALEKNVVELEKLVELRNQNLAELQQQAAGAAKPEAVATPLPPAVAPMVPAAKPEPAPEAAGSPAEKAVEPVAAPSTEPKVEPAPKPAEVPAPKPAPVPPPPPEEPGFVDDLLGNPLALAGGGAILALIAAYVVARRRRDGKEEAPLDLSSTLTPQSSALTANSVFRSTGGQSVDTSHTPVQTDFSQAGPGSIDTDEVDPVAEADVYMAYGRDVQAEEILIEARQKDPKRHAIHLKLLEIYSNRKDLKQFETLVTDLYGDTGGVGVDWEKAAAMGLKLNPGNPLFGASAKAIPAFDADATVIVAPQSMKNTVALPGELSRAAEKASADGARPISSEPAPASDVLATAEAPALTSLDFDLDLGETERVEPSGDVKARADDTPWLVEPAAEVGALDFDLAPERSDAGDAESASASAVEPRSSDLERGLPDTPASSSFKKTDSIEVADLDFDSGIASSPADEMTATRPFGQVEANDTVTATPR